MHFEHALSNIHSILIRFKYTILVWKIDRPKFLTFKQCWFLRFRSYPSYLSERESNGTGKRIEGHRKSIIKTSVSWKYRNAFLMCLLHRRNPRLMWIIKKHFTTYVTKETHPVLSLYIEDTIKYATGFLSCVCDKR